MSTGESKIELPTMSYGLAGPSGTEPLDTTTMPHVPGYEIVRLVGEGGMGIVFEAFQLKPRRRVALKIIRPGLLSDAMLQSFNQEIEILGRLTHPAIAHIYEAGTAELSGQQHPYFAMEYVEGTPITAYAEANRLTLPERINLLIRISDGVHHAHQKGVIHRDLKPGNILVDESGSPRILDFGVSRVIEQDTTQHASRHVGELLGTPAYMAPEQAAGDDAQADVRADVYSLGVVAYELLTGERPHKLKGLPVSKAVEVILQETPRRLGRYDRRFRGDLEIIVAKALEKDRDDRYDSVAAWAADLGRYMRNEPIWARAPSACYQVAKFAKRNAVLVASVVLVFLALLFGMTAAGIGLFRARAAEAESNRQRERALVNLHQAIDTVDRFMTLVARGELAAIPEASAVRQHLLRDAIAFYERFLEKNRDDPRLQEALSWSLVHLATAYGEIGAIEQATELRARHIRKVTRRLETERDTLELRHELARSLSELGVLLRRQGEEHQAVSRLNQAEQKYRHLLALDPENERYLREYARNFCEKGEALAAAGAGDKAVVARKKAANIRQQLLLAHPSSLEYKRDLARSFSERSSLLRRQGRLAEARNAAEEAVALRRRLVTRAPHNMHYLKDLAKGLKALGFVCSSLGDAQAAETAFREATDLHRKRVEAYPRQNEYIRDLARSLHDWARLLRADGRLDEAIDMLLEANELFQKLPAHGPHYQKYRSDLARNYSEQGQTHTQMNDHATAQAKFRQAHQIIEELMLRNPGHPDLQRDLAMLLNNWSLAVSPQEATELLEEARPILEELVHARPAVSSLRRALSWNASQLLRHELSKDSSARTSARRESIPGFGKSPADGFFQVDEPQNEFPPPADWMRGQPTRSVRPSANTSLSRDALFTLTRRWGPTKSALSE